LNFPVLPNAFLTVLQHDFVFLMLHHAADQLFVNP
jgi:hypothetical protein